MKNVILVYVALILTGCGTRVTPDESDLGRQDPVLTAQQVTVCRVENVQRVHRGFFQEPANSGIYPIKAKALVSCSKEFLNMTVNFKLVILKKSGTYWKEVGAFYKTERVGLDGIDGFLQENVNCVNGVYKSKVYIQENTFNLIWLPMPNGESTENSITNC